MELFYDSLFSHFNSSCGNIRESTIATYLSEFTFQTYYYLNECTLHIDN